MPLGDYEPFRGWSGKPRDWGPDGAGWRAWFGGGVVDGLCDVLDEHLTTRYGREMRPAAIGCVPWLTSEAVVDRLLKLNSVCVVIDKGASQHALNRLCLPDHGFPNEAVSRLADMMPANADGSAPLTIGPHTPRGATWHDIDPIRVAGWLHGRRKPLVHAKMLVLGRIGWTSYDTPYGLDEGNIRFTPLKVWWGSANWTDPSTTHLEVGFVSDDSKLADSAADFVADMIAFSEPITSSCPGPEPNLVEVGYDNEAMAQAAAEYEEAHEGYDEDDY